MIYEIINIILLGIWFVLITLFLREFVYQNRKTIHGTNIISMDDRSYIIYKYIPFFMILLFIDIVRIYFL